MVRCAGLRRVGPVVAVVVGLLTLGIGVAPVGAAPAPVGRAAPVASGTVAGGAAPVASRFHASGPRRVLDSRAASQVGPYSTPFASGVTRSVAVAGVGDVPAGAAVVVANVTIGGPSAAGFVSVWPAGQPWPGVSSLNFASGQVVANQVTVPVGAGGAWSVLVAGAAADVVVDVTGWYGGSVGDAFHPLPPARVLDSRPATQVGPYSTPFASGVARAVTVAGVADVPAGAHSVVANITVGNPTGAGFVSVWPAGQPWPGVSSVNFSAGQVIANQVTVTVGAGGAWSVLVAGGSADVVVDIAGWYDGDGGDSIWPLSTPARVLDSRPASQVGPYSTPFSSGVARDVVVAGGSTGVPAGADSVVVNVTVGNPTGGGFVTVWPAGQSRPLASSLNFTAGRVVPNAVSVKVGAGGAISIFVAGGSADVVVDVFAWHAPPPATILAGGAAIGCSHCIGGYEARSVDGGSTYAMSTTSDTVNALLRTPTSLIRGGNYQPDPFSLFGYVSRSTDGGITSTHSSVIVPNGAQVSPRGLTSLVRTAAGTLVAWGTAYVLTNGSLTQQPMVMRSTDDGATWTLAVSAIGGYARLRSGPSGLLTLDGAGTHLVRSSDDGISWVADAASLPEVFTAVHVTPSGLLGVAGTAVYRSTDDGSSWSVPVTAPVSLTDVAVTSGGLVGVGTGEAGSGVVRSTDGGVTWSAVPSAGAPSCSALYAVTATSAGLVTVGVAGSTPDLTAQGCVARSTDGGRSWVTTLVAQGGLSSSFSAVTEI